MSFWKSCLRYFNLVKPTNVEDQEISNNISTELTSLDIDVSVHGITIESLASEEETQEKQELIYQDALEEEPNQSSNDEAIEYVKDVQSEYAMEKDALATDSD